MADRNTKRIRQLETEFIERVIKQERDKSPLDMRLDTLLPNLKKKEQRAETILNTLQTGGLKFRKNS